MEACQIGPSYIPVPVPVSKFAAFRAKLYTQGGTRLHQVTVIFKYTAAVLCVVALFALAVKKYRQSQQTEAPPPPYTPPPYAPPPYALFSASPTEVAKAKDQMDYNGYIQGRDAANKWIKDHPPLNASNMDRNVYRWIHNYCNNGKILDPNLTFEELKRLVEHCLQFKPVVFKRCLEDGREMIYMPGWTVLMDAALKGHVDVVKTLLKLDVDITLCCEGLNALMAAAAQNSTEVMKLLLTEEVTDKQGRTALTIAVQNNNVEGVRVLLTGEGYLKYRASVESIAKALRYALAHQHKQGFLPATDPQIVQMLQASLTDAQQDAAGMEIFQANQTGWKARSS